ncbi:MAG: GNAT family N-acetyltransferase [Anaerolineae bacterium]|nr:GNAT family N-acetyltransferase [Anaerolineae bacterium]
MTLYPIRPMQPADVDAGMRLKAAVGWNQTADDWRLFLRLNPDGCFVATHEGEVIGTVTSLNYENAVAWISMVLVDPTFRRQGIGTQLVQAVIDSLSGCQIIGLDATLAGQNLYQSLGFAPESGLKRFVNTCVTRFYSTSTIVLLTQDRLAPAANQDRQAFGASRHDLLHCLASRCPDLALLRQRSSQPAGFCLGRDGARYAQIGPLVAETLDDAIALCSAALANLSEQAALIDVPDAQAEFRAWLETQGFFEQRSFLRMYFGNNRPTGNLSYQFAIAGPELG